MSPFWIILDYRMGSQMQHGFTRIHRYNHRHTSTHNNRTIWCECGYIIWFIFHYNPYCCRLKCQHCLTENILVLVIITTCLYIRTKTPSLRSENTRYNHPHVINFNLSPCGSDVSVCSVTSVDDALTKVDRPLFYQDLVWEGILLNWEKTNSIVSELVILSHKLTTDSINFKLIY